MIQPSSLRATLGLSFGVLALASVLGCQGVVTKGGGDEGGGGAGGGAGGGGDTTTDPGTGGVGGGGNCDPAACPSPAIAMSHAQYATAMGEDPNGGLLTDTQYLQYGGGTQTPSCGAPFGTSDCGGWTVSLTLPTSYMLTPGTYPLSDVAVDIYFTETFADGGGQCAGTGGIGFEEGEITIMQVSDTHVLFDVFGVGQAGETFNPNGFFSAPRCP